MAPEADSLHGLFFDNPTTPEAQFLDGHRVALAPGASVSFGGLLNAFPAAWWRRYTRVREANLIIEVSGADSSVRLATSNVLGDVSIGPPHRPVDGVVEMGLRLDGRFEGGGWAWPIISAGREAAEMLSARFEVQGDPVVGTVMAGIVTFDRPDECLDLLTDLTHSDQLVGVVDEVVIIDQGSRLVIDHPGWTDVVHGSVIPVRHVRQENLGGAGGFSRVMLEGLETDHAFVLLLDDDVSLVPECVLRMAAFARFATRPTIVGAQMLSSVHPTSLHAFAEVVDPQSFFWVPAPGTHPDVDLAATPLTSAGWAHRVADSDYAGWWTCLIPVAIIRAVGTALPLFIKWDDVEYGLRAASLGARTVTLPGTAVWHVPWAGKGDVLGWQSYFLERNRMVAALLHARPSVGRTLALNWLVHQFKHLVAMQYGTARLRLRAVNDVLRGPTVLADGGLGLRSELDRLTDRALGERIPPGTPAVRIEQARWRTLVIRRRATAVDASGTVLFSYRRDVALAFRLAGSSIMAALKLASSWKRLRRSFKSSLAALAAPEGWRERFGVF